MWREIFELSRPKNVVLAAITVPLGAHLALSGAWTVQALGLVALQTTSAICFMAEAFILSPITPIAATATLKATPAIFILLTCFSFSATSFLSATLALTLSFKPVLKIFYTHPIWISI